MTHGDDWPSDPDRENEQPRRLPLEPQAWSAPAHNERMAPQPYPLAPEYQSEFQEPSGAASSMPPPIPPPPPPMPAPPPAVAQSTPPVYSAPPANPMPPANPAPPYSPAPPAQPAPPVYSAPPYSAPPAQPAPPVYSAPPYSSAPPAQPAPPVYSAPPYSAPPAQPAPPVYSAPPYSAPPAQPAPPVYSAPPYSPAPPAQPAPPVYSAPPYSAPPAPVPTQYVPPSSVAQSQLPPPPGPGYQTQPPEPSLPRRHRVGVRGQARPRRRWVLAVAGPLVLVVLVGAGAYFGRSWLAAGGTGCAGGKVMRLAVAPEIQPLVDRAAAGTGDRCVTVKTTVLNPGQTASSLAGGDFDGWIPASSAWLGLQSESSGTGGATAQPTATGTPGSGGSGFAPASLVRTPLVVAAPYPLAQQLGWPKQEPTWAVLAGAVIAGKIPRFSMDSPVRTATGLLGVLAVQAAMNRTTPDQGIAQLRALTLRSRLTDAEADAPTLLQKLGGLSDPVAAVRDVGAFPVTEQALRTYEQGQPAVPLAAMYPADGLMEADYPLALTPSAAADSDRRDMANRIVARFRSADFAPTVTSFGFRSAAPQAQGAPPPSAPAGQPGDGLLAQYPTTTPVPTNPVLVNQLADQWARYQRINFNVLVLIDGSASMDEQVRDRSGHLTTKAGLLRVAGAQAAQLFGLDTSLALWVFATQTPTSPPYTVAIPFGPLDQPLAGPGSPTRRAALAKAVSTFQPFVPGATPLYESVLRGVTTMQPLVRPGSLTLVVVLTDGRDEQSPYAMSRQQFLTRLNAIRDPQRPVPVFAIGYGTDADMGALNSMAQATGGRAVASNDPGDLASAVAQIFLAAHNAR